MNFNSVGSLLRDLAEGNVKDDVKFNERDIHMAAEILRKVISSAGSELSKTHGDGVYNSFIVPMMMNSLKDQGMDLQAYASKHGELVITFAGNRTLVIGPDVITFLSPKNGIQELNPEWKEISQALQAC